MQNDQSTSTSPRGNQSRIRNQLKVSIFTEKRIKQLTQQPLGSIGPIISNQSTPDAHSDSSSNGFQSPKRRSLLTASIHKPRSTVSFEEEWQCKKKVGEGAHAIVKICIPRKHATEDDAFIKKFAVKVFRTGDPEIINTIKATFHNNRYLHDCSYFCKAYELYIDERREVTHFVMEYFDYPSLEQLLKQKSITNSIAQKVIRCLAQAVEQMHTKGIAHRDLKPDNILIKLNNKQKQQNQQPQAFSEIEDLKIIDFGVSKKFLQKVRNFQKIREMWTRTGTIFYQAPEIFEAVCYGQEVDVWSIGVILYQMLCQSLPYQCETILDTITLITEDTECYEKDQKFRNLVPLQQDLIRRLLKKDPSKRLTAQEISLHPWFRNYKIQTQSTQDDGYIQNRMGEFHHILTQSTYLDLKFDFRNSVQPVKQAVFFSSGANNIEEEDEPTSPTKPPRNKHDWDYSDHIHHVKKETQNNFTLFKIQEIPQNEDIHHILKNQNVNNDEDNDHLQGQSYYEDKTLSGSLDMILY